MLILDDDDIQAFLKEATLLDPRFKSNMDRDEIWDRVRASVVAAIEKVSEPRETQVHAEEEDREAEEDEDENYVSLL
ncbi:hypothetical protein PFLUV_G00143700 [Perca fluviatilis]|uniref:Uncharacterized protein n=1 Tax=Perca fluviatilis TaxID=8168 RepID=A0A6A5EVR3_PERFL|nr:hypothetical protein PFLUV_G00143700 [Perca fluviatilis]